MNKKSDPKEKLVNQAEVALAKLLDTLTNLPSRSGCELLLRRKGAKPGWTKISTDSGFSTQYRKMTQEAVELAGEHGISLLEYNNVIEGEHIGVAYSAEIDTFTSDIPAKGAAIKFDGDKGTFSRFNQRCVRISLPGLGELLAFGPAGVSPVSKIGNSSLFAIFEDKQIVKAPEVGYLNVGFKVSFFVFQGYVFVVDNKNFATMTEFREVVKKRAKLALKKLKKLKFLKISNFDRLQSLCENSPDFAARISASDARGFFDNLSREGLLECISGFTISFDYDDDGTTVSLNPDFSKTTEKQEFLKLLTQVYVNCAVTGDPMEAAKLIPHKKS